MKTVEVNYFLESLAPIIFHPTYVLHQKLNTPYASILWITLLPPILHFIKPAVPYSRANTLSFSNPTSIIGGI